MGLYYLNNEDYEKAFNYFKKGINTTLRATCLWNYHNLAKYFYLNGNININISKDINISIEYFKLSAQLIESLIELLYIYVLQNKKDLALNIIKKIKKY